MSDCQKPAPAPNPPAVAAPRPAVAPQHDEPSSHPTGHADAASAAGNHLSPQPWNKRSGVTACDTCDGAGRIASFRRPSVNDPYPEQPCPDCVGEHAAECPVCGFDQVVKGYDCLACDTAASLTDGELAAFDAEGFAAALKIAVEKARAGARVAS